MRTFTTVAAMILGLSLALPAQAVETNAGETVHNTHHVQFWANVHTSNQW